MGSILFAPLWGHIFCHKDILADTKDHNPGTANAFMQGGFWCGILTLSGDMGKGFLPVFACIHLREFFHVNMGESLFPKVMFALVLAAPVCGHVFSVYAGFRGGKGIAVTFGCLLGFCPDLRPALLLAVFFLAFSLLVRISPHYYRTLATYLCGAICFLLCGETLEQKLGFILITLIVCIRMHLSPEERGECKVRLLWMH